MRAIAQDLRGVTFSVPEPIFMFRKGIGNVVTAAGQHLYPTFPDMPDQILAGRGGYYGPLDVLTIARYLDVPCLGVLSEAVCQSTSAAAVGAYVSEVALAGLNAAHANSNLPGFFPLGHRREKAKNIALSAGITPLAFPSDYPGLGFNTRFAMSVSSVIASTRTFSVSTINFATLSEQGSTAQLIKLNPLVIDDPATPVYDMEARPTSTIRESPAIFGVASFTQYCLFREPNAQPHPHNVWSPLTHTDDDPINPLWLPFRNLRRYIPEYIQADVFTSVSQKSREYRQTVVRLMVKSTR